VWRAQRIYAPTKSVSTHKGGEKGGGSIGKEELKERKKETNSVCVGGKNIWKTGLLLPQAILEVKNHCQKGGFERGGLKKPP